MIDRKLPGPIAQPFNIPTQRTLWFSGERDDIKYAMYVVQDSPQLVLVVEKGGVVVREVASVENMFGRWCWDIIKEMEAHE